MSDQTVRLVFLGEAGQALTATNTVTTGVRKLSAAQKEQAASARASTVESGRASQGFRTLERDIEKTSRGALAGSGIFRGLGRSIAFASASFLGGYGLLAVVTSSINVMKEAGVNAAETAQRIRATGGAAGVTARQIDVLANATARKTAYDVEQIHAAENVLLTFTEVRNELGKGNDVYTRAVGLTADLARSMKEDVSAAALQLGRALNDPVRGLTTLSRAGVQFTAQQREQVKALAESGEILKAQNIILDVVAAKVGGVAQAYGGTAAGKIDTFRGEIRLLEKDLATALLPDLVKLVDHATAWAQKLESNKPAQQQFRHDIEGIAGAVGTVAHLLHQATEAVGGTKNALELLLGLKVAKWFSEIYLGLAKTIGTAAAAEGAAGGAGLLGASGAAGGLLAKLTKLTRMAAAPIIITVVINSLIKKLTGYDALGTAINDATAGGSGDTLPIKKGGKWVDSVTGQVLSAADQKYWNKHPPAGVAKAFAPGKGFADVVPASANATVGKEHPTSGLSGFPAHDIFVTPGTPVLAPEDGAITRLTGHDPAQGSSGSAGVLGYSIYFVGDSGTTYYLTHLAQVGGLGRYTKGQEIGTVAYHPRGSHVHVGIFQGSSTMAYLPSSVKANLGSGGTGGGKGPPRRGRGGTGGPSRLQQLELGLAQAGVTKDTGDDRAALQGLIAYYKQQLANPNLPITTRIADLNTEGGYISQLDALAPKGPGKASAAALVNIHHTLDAVTKLVDRAGLDKRFDPALAKINDELASKFVTTETLAKIRNRLGDISKAATAEIRKAAAAVKANKAAFAQTWADLASDAFNAFDKETASHISPSRAMLNQLVDEHDAAARQKALADAQKNLADVLAGKGTSGSAGTLNEIRGLIGQAALANAVDKTQSGVLGIAPQQVTSEGLIAQLQQLLVQQTVPDAQAVADAQQQVDDAQYAIRVADLGKQADAEDTAYATARQALRDALEKQTAAWADYYKRIGEKAVNAAKDFATVWGGVLGQFPGYAGGTGGNLTTSTGELFTPGSLGAQGYFLLNPPVSMASGGEGVALKPTLFVAGDNGAEHYKFTPLRGGAAGSSTGGDAAHIHLSLGEGLDQLVDAKIVKATPGISLSIGRAADNRRRSGRY